MLLIGHEHVCIGGKFGWWGCWGAAVVWEWVCCVCVGSGEGWASFGRGRIFLVSASGTCTGWSREWLEEKKRKSI